MKWKKSSEELVERFYAALPDDVRVERRKMFGYPCAFVNGNMFTGLHEERMIVRLPEEAREKLLARKGAAPFEALGRVMREYVVLPSATKAAERAAWVQQAFGYAAALPPKKKKGRAK